MLLYTGEVPPTLYSARPSVGEMWHYLLSLQKKADMIKNQTKVNPDIYAQARLWDFYMKLKSKTIAKVAHNFLASGTSQKGIYIFFSLNEEYSFLEQKQHLFVYVLQCFRSYLSPGEKIYVSLLGESLRD